jgi:hypothetical protein
LKKGRKIVREKNYGEKVRGGGIQEKNMRKKSTGKKVGKKTYGKIIRGKKYGKKVREKNGTNNTGRGGSTGKKYGKKRDGEKK